VSSRSQRLQHLARHPTPFRYLLSIWEVPVNIRGARIMRLDPKQCQGRRTASFPQHAAQIRDGFDPQPRIFSNAGCDQRSEMGIAESASKAGCMTLTTSFRSSIAPTAKIAHTIRTNPHSHLDRSQAFTCSDAYTATHPIAI
jgi:hypothetical protein